MCAGILVVQCITVSLAGYAFARLDFPFRGTIFTLFVLPVAISMFANFSEAEEGQASRENGDV